MPVGRAIILFVFSGLNSAWILEGILVYFKKPLLYTYDVKLTRR